MNTDILKNEYAVDLIALCESISTEEFESYSNEAFSDNFKNLIPRLSVSLNRFIKLHTTWNFSRPDTLSVRPFDTVINRARYKEIKGFALHHPAGFKGEIHEFVSLLREGYDSFGARIDQDFLTPVIADVSRLLNNQDNLRSVRPTKVTRNYNPSNLNQYAGKMSKFFIKGNVNNISPLGDLYNNCNEISLTHIDMNDLTGLIWARKSKSSPAYLKKRMETLDSLLVTLLDAMGDTKYISPVVIKEFLGTLKLVPEWFEMYTTLLVQVVDMNAALLENQRILMRTI